MYYKYWYLPKYNSDDLFALLKINLFLGAYRSSQQPLRSKHIMVCANNIIPNQLVASLNSLHLLVLPESHFQIINWTARKPQV